jgi:lipoate-protein ligase A
LVLGNDLLVTSMGSRNCLLLRSGAGRAAFNMALDDALLEAAPELGRSILRFYSWTEPAASFGYFQKFAEIEKMTMLRPLIRRPTGGGLVPHDADWTYSLVFPPGDSWYELKATASYQRAHEWIQAAFLRLGVTSEVASAAKKALPGQCFVGHEKSDVLWHGRKIAGAAQRRTRHGLLIQGSVQPPPVKLARADWEDAMCEVARLDFGVEWQDFQPSSALNARVAELVDKTYSQPAYNQRR